MSAYKFAFAMAVLIAAMSKAFPSLAQTPPLLPNAAAKVCEDKVVADNVIVILKKYIGEHKWSERLAPLFEKTSEEVANDMRFTSAEGSTSAICRADLSFAYFDETGGRRQVKIKDLSFLVSTSHGHPSTMETYKWPSDDDPLDVGMTFLAKWSLDGKDVTQPLSAILRAQAAAAASSPRPQNVLEAMSMMNAAAKEQAEGYARQQGFGGMIDAEAARRARLTPKERAAESAYNAGPARGETICIVKDGVQRCKTGR